MVGVVVGSDSIKGQRPALQSEPGHRSSPDFGFIERHDIGDHGEPNEADGDPERSFFKQVEDAGLLWVRCLV
jgi:hypothetical protein